jgi:K+-transporting ATPase KdpF subunit
MDANQAAYLASGVVAFMVTIYLFVALLFPERF